MPKFTGLKLNFKKGKDAPEIVTGEKIQPHRVDLIKKLLDENKLNNIENLFFNFNVPGYSTASTRKHIIKENALLDRYFKMIGENNDGNSTKK